MIPTAAIALVTGANRGIGLEVTRQLAEQGMTIYLGSRVLEQGRAAAQTLIQSGFAVIPCQLDVNRPAEIEQVVGLIDTSFGRLDVLVNNAGILYDTWQTAVTADLGQVQQAWDTNTLGSWRLVQGCLPLLRRSAHPRIVNVSSGAGSWNSMTGSTPAYSLSKLALNGLTRMLAAELPAMRVNAVCPGWVATEMGGAGGRPVAEGAASVVWAALLSDEGPTGGFFRDGKRLDW